MFDDLQQQYRSQEADSQVYGIWAVMGALILLGAVIGYGIRSATYTAPDEVRLSLSHWKCTRSVKKKDLSIFTFAMVSFAPSAPSAPVMPKMPPRYDGDDLVCVEYRQNQEK